MGQSFRLLSISFCMAASVLALSAWAEEPGDTTVSGSCTLLGTCELRKPSEDNGCGGVNNNAGTVCGVPTNPAVFRDCLCKSDGVNDRCWCFLVNSTETEEPPGDEPPPNGP